MINTIFYFPQAKLTYSDYAAAVQNGEISERTIVLDKASGKIFNQGKEYGYSVQEIQTLVNTSIEENRFDPTELQTEINRLGTNLQTEISSLRADLQQLIIDIQNQSFKGDKGEMSFTSNVFKRSATKPNKPGANEGSFSDPVPSGWSDGVPAGTDSIWTTKRIFSSDGQYPQQASWEDVQLMSDTESFDVEFSPVASNPGTPTTNPNNWYDPTADANADWANMIWMATRTKSNGVWGNWNVTKIKGEKGEKGDAGSEITFDDTEIQNAISSLRSSLADANAAAESERTRLTNLINSLDNSIQDKVEDLLDDATWVQDNFPEGSGSSSNFGQQDVENYLQTIGVWTTDGQGNTVTQWSKLSQDVNGISSRVTQLEGSASTGGDVNYSLLSSSLYNYIQDNYATSGMSSTWAKFAQLSNGDMQMLKWMSAGAASYANDAQSVANLFAAAKDFADDGSAINQAVSDINALVERDQNNNLVAKSSMTSMVNTAITGIINTATNSQAGTTIFSKVDENSDNIAALVTKITGVESSASIAAQINDMSAGVLTKADLNNATTSMVANGKSVSAAIIAAVNNDTSSVHINADKIELDGSVIAQKLTAAQATISNITVNNADVSGTLVATNGSSNSVSINGNGFEAKWGDEGLKVGASGIQRWDATRNVWSPMYEKKICYVSKTSSVNLGDSEHKGVNYLLNANVLPDGQYSQIYLPSASSVPNGATITVRGLTRDCDSIVNVASNSYDKILIGDNMHTSITMLAADCAEFIMCKNINVTTQGVTIGDAWLCNFYDQDV